MPQLGAAVRPCAADLRACALSDSQLQRVIAALRTGRPVRIESKRPLTILSVETGDAAMLVELDPEARAPLLISGWRAAARHPLINRGARASGSSSTSMAASPVSTERIVNGRFDSILTGRPVRSAAITRCSCESLKAQARKSAAHGRTAAPSCGTARGPYARQCGRQAPATPTYDRDAGRDRSGSSRASGSSTR